MSTDFEGGWYYRANRGVRALGGQFYPVVQWFYKRRNRNFGATANGILPDDERHRGQVRFLGHLAGGHRGSAGLTATLTAGFACVAFANGWAYDLV